MVMSQPQNINQEILAFVMAHFPLARKRGLREGDPLLENGIVDSMGVLELVEFIESKFDVKVSEDELMPENFQSVQRIATFVNAKRPAKPAAAAEPSSEPTAPAASDRLGER
jgi:acyl carrier protein